VLQIWYRPGRSLTTLYRVAVEAGSREVVLTTEPTPPSGTVLTDGETRLGAWIHPRDPFLPGLGVVLDSDGRAKLLRQIGLTGASSAKVRSYRPGRRAVVEVTAADRRLFAKVVRPSRVGDLQQIHRLADGLVPIPRSLGWSPELGVVLLEALPGVPLASSPDRLPSPSAVLELLDALPAHQRTISDRRNRTALHLAILREIVPGLSDHLDHLEEAVGGLTTLERRPAHGDFHPGQIMVANGSVSGLVDIDTLGMGSRADDVANLIAHLHILAFSDRRFARFGHEVFTLSATELNPTDLRHRVSAALVGYAVGPWTRQAPDWEAEVTRRIAAATQWVTTRRPTP
jgi:aminoglycoside phosphotransferase